MNPFYRFLLLGLLISPSLVHACSCMHLNLEQHYLRTPNVFTAVITGVQFVECNDRDSSIRCSNYEAQFEATKIYKGSTPFSVITSHVGGASCGTSLGVGIEYLFFMDDSGATSLCSGTRTVTGAEPWVTEELERLESYVSGKSPDLSSPWYMSEYDGLCIVGTDFLIESGKEFPYSGRIETSFRKAVGTQSRRWPNLNNEAGFSAVLVDLPVVNNPKEQPIELIIGNQTFPMTWLANDDGWGGQYALFGEGVTRFSSLMENLDEIRVQGVIPEIGRIDSEVRTTNIGNAISDFVDCTTTTD